MVQTTHKLPLPAFIPLPDASTRRSIPREDWSAYLEATTALVNAYLGLSDEEFSSISGSTNSLPSLVLSYLESTEKHFDDENSILLSNDQKLRHGVFLLTHRLVTTSAKSPESFIDWKVLGTFAKVYRNSNSTNSLLETIWESSKTLLETSLIKYKTQLGSCLKTGVSPEQETHLTDHLLPLVAACKQAGMVFVTGSDFLDPAIEAYTSLGLQLRSKILLLVYLSLESLIRGEKPHEGPLVDLLFGIKSDTEAQLKTQPGRATLLSDIISETPLLRKIQSLGARSGSARTQNLVESLQRLRHAPTRHRHKKQKVDKGKEKAANDLDGAHFHRMSLISQIQDLFPDIGTAFAAKLLDEYNEDVEQVTAHLLEDSLPAHLRNADRGENLPSHTGPVSADHAPALSPRPTPPPSPRTETRRNIFDNDDFDRLQISTSQLHLGRRHADKTADQLLSDRSSHATNKAAILSALAAFDADDDERDDTYDLADVGGTVDSPHPDADADAAAGSHIDQTEEALFTAYTSDPNVFARDADTRRGKARLALKTETGLTDEAVEGWAVMLKRDPRRLRRLEAKYAAFTGRQRALAGTSWGAVSGSGTEDSDVASGPEGSGRGGGFRGRGRGRGRGPRGGGDVAGPSNDAAAQAARQRKESSKGSRANHNRRDQRAKKMARGGFPG